MLADRLTIAVVITESCADLISIGTRCFITPSETEQYRCRYSAAAAITSTI